MTARDIQRRLVHDLLKTGNFVVPNFTPPGWFECDVFCVTGSGFFREYEVKLTLSDFKADADKRDIASYRRRHEAIGSKYPLPPERNKHALLAGASADGPKQFWFVVPVTLVEQVRQVLPVWAGLLVAETTSRKAAPFNVHIHEQVAAPMLHSSKLDQKVKDRATAACYWRFNRNFTIGKFWKEVI